MEYNKVATCAERIKTALVVNGMRQSELCRLTKIPKSAISQYLSGAYEPKQDRIYLIAKTLNVSEAWLMGLDAPMERDGKTSPDKLQLTEGEKVWLELYHKLSDETKVVLVNMAEAFESLPADKQRFLVDAIRVVFDNQK